MTDEQTQDENKEPVPPVQESSNQESSDEGKSHWQRARGALKEKDLTIRQQELLIRQLEDRLNRFAQPQQQAQEESINDDDLLTGKHARTLEERIRKKVLSEVDQLVDKREKAREVQKLSNDKSAWSVIEKYTDQLEEHFPHLARRLHNDPEAPLLAYEAIKNSRFFAEGEAKAAPKVQVKEKIVSPPSGMTTGSPMAQASSFQNMEVGDNLWRAFVKQTGYSG